MRKIFPLLFVLLAVLLGSLSAHAQGGPPYLTNDPGTPGNANWEINIAAAPTVTRDVKSWQLPQFDINFGIGDRIQLTYEVPYVFQTNAGQPSQTAWGNASTGVKWRFLDHGEKSWQLSTFPQVETSGTSAAQQKGIAAPGPRFFLPLEVQKRVGPLDMNFEAGYFFPWNGPDERILGLVAGREITRKFEWDGEIFNDKIMGEPSQNTMFDMGGRYKIRPAFIFLFMAGRSFSANSSGHPEFMGYFGVQILLSKYGKTLTKD